MDKASEAIFSLKPVTFHYKNDKTNIPQFGLIAEEVAKVNPALIAVDKEGKPYSVRYQQINAMLLNEFLKEHEMQELKRQFAADSGLAEVNASLKQQTRRQRQLSLKGADNLSMRPLYAASQVTRLGFMGLEFGWRRLRRRAGVMLCGDSKLRRIA